MPTSLAAVLVVSMTAAIPARAQPAVASGDKVAAEALFEDGRKLMAAGRYADACPKFADSHGLDPTPATLLNLANCYDKLGRTATAWATYKEAASAANAAGRADYTATAQRHAALLEPTLSRLTVNIRHPVDAMQVSRDAVVVKPAEWGAPIPIDPGSHQVTVSAPGYKVWTTSVSVGPDGAQAAVDVPPLEAAPVAATPAPPPAPPPAVVAPSPAPPSSPSPPPAADSGGGAGSTQRALGLTLAGLGVAGLGVGAVFAVVAKNKYDDSLVHCEATNRDLCDGNGVSLRNDARSAGDAATVAFGVGAAAVVAGGVLWLTAPRGAGSHTGSAASLVVAPTLGGAVVRGAF